MEAMKVPMWNSALTSEETTNLLGIGTNNKIACVNSEYVLAIRKLLMNMKVNQ